MLPPLEEPKFLPVRIDDQGDLPRLTEKVSVNEQIVGRKEDAKIRMRMVPADNDVVRILFFHDTIGAGPRIRGKRQ